MKVFHLFWVEMDQILPIMHLKGQNCTLKGLHHTQILIHIGRPPPPYPQNLNKKSGVFNPSKMIHGFLYKSLKQHHAFVYKPSLKQKAYSILKSIFNGTNRIKFSAKWVDC